VIPTGNGSPHADACLPAEAWAAALASLPGMFPGRLARLLTRWSAAEAWERVAAGSWFEAFTEPGPDDEPTLLGDADVDPPAGRPRSPGWLRRSASVWQGEARSLDVADCWFRYRQAGVGVAVCGSPAMPTALADDMEPPAVVFTLGDPGAVRGPMVAIVGTRSATRYGLDVAAELGAQLAEAGVVVVSGLAQGIDASAHRGVLGANGAPPVAVVGSGVDVIYPRANAALWRAVGERGLVLSESPLGARPERWRFPARNRMIAALADAVVVVESHPTGGSLLTVNEAQRRAVPVLAVPGPIRSSASAGANRLLADGATPVCDVGDVLVCLDLSPASRRAAVDRRAEPPSEAWQVLDAMAWQPASTEMLALRAGLPLPELATTLSQLQADGWIAVRDGWYERISAAGT
jgi:DNA processing protein